MLPCVRPELGAASVLVMALAVAPACKNDETDSHPTTTSTTTTSTTTSSSTGSGGGGGGTSTGGGGAGGAAELCTTSGGTLTTALCCTSTGDFPSSCSTGSCGCAPQYSHEVAACACPASHCFDPAHGCVSL
ncbi:MAG: hypothetical protein IT373_07065 [Polyangiaceae bacterium]|nr:hypothetical protein [Polyangiaceae bacterium]